MLAIDRFEVARHRSSTRILANLKRSQPDLGTYTLTVLTR